MLYPLSYGTVAVSLYLIVRRTQRGGTSSVPTLTFGNQLRHRCLFPPPQRGGGKTGKRNSTASGMICLERYAYRPSAAWTVASASASRAASSARPFSAVANWGKPKLPEGE